jgi:hypothetical protein
VSGELNAHAVPTRPLFANEPGVVPAAVLDGLSPRGGSTKSISSVVVVVVSASDWVERTIAHGSFARRRREIVRARAQRGG